MRHFISISALLLICFHVQADPVRLWSFENLSNTGAVTTLVEGVRGKAALFDGFNTYLEDTLSFAKNELSLSAWVAPQEYSWNKSPFMEVGNVLWGIDDVGHVVVQMTDSGKTYLSKSKLPLLEWSFVAVSMKSGGQLVMYVNSQKDSVFGIDEFNISPSAAVSIGKSSQKQVPIGAERKNSRDIRRYMFFDGLIDELRVDDCILKGSQVNSLSQLSLTNKRPLKYRQLPSGKADPMDFGAYYTKLEYYPAWDAQFRGSDCPDIVVRFGKDNPTKLVFWRGTGYIPAFVTENNIWMTDQSVENFGTGECYEVMGDKQCRYSHIRLLENTAARVVVHWRYALAGVKYQIFLEDEYCPGDWVDEYWTAYPDGVVVRNQILWSDFPEKFVNSYQFQETIFFNQPGTRPEDNVDYKAITFMNMDGSTASYSWENGVPANFDNPRYQPVQMVNTKSEYKPFGIYYPDRKTYPFRFGWTDGYTRFPCWNHWPVARIPSDGRNSKASDKVSHSSLTQVNCDNQIYERRDDGSVRVCSMMGLTNNGIESLLPLALSWNEPPQIVVDERDFNSAYYDKYKRCYVLSKCQSDDKVVQIDFKASAESPLCGLALEISSCDTVPEAVYLNGKRLEIGKDVQIGKVFSQENEKLLLWIDCNMKEESTLLLQFVEEIFRNPEYTFKQRAENIVSLLTTQEKILQMMNDAPEIERLGIPSYEWWNECLHGVARTDYRATSFPQAIAMAATWNTEAVALMGQYVSDEGRAIHNDASRKGNRGRYLGLTYWTPNVNIFRDPRWGRGQETYGEDPFLTSKMGIAYVKALQGDHPKYLKTSACAKHFAVHSGPEWNRSYFNAVASDQDLWQTYLPAFEALVREAKVSGVMGAYNAFRGQPCCTNDLLMNDILRDKWDFQGYVTSDCGAINNLYRAHKSHPDKESAAADAVKHNTDCECSGDGAYNYLNIALLEKMLSIEDIDESLRRLFEIRLRLGLFDPEAMVPYSNIPIDVLDRKEHRDHALKMARESIVLLKNENDVLPLKDDVKKIALVGPNAIQEEVMLGNYNGMPKQIWSIKEGLQERLGSDVEIIYEPGCGYVDKVINESGAESDFDHVVRNVSDADVIIFAGGISPALEGEDMEVNAEGFKGGDRLTIELPQVQRELMKKLVATGKDVIFVMLTGSAIAVEWESKNVDAIINAWYPGQEGGLAIADVLTGRYNPSGKLPVTFYEKDADLPDFEDYSMEGRTYRFFKGNALYPFGYGLSYTDFSYSPLIVKELDDAYEVFVTVSNTGKFDGEEVVQLYVSSSERSFRVPQLSLMGFQKVHIGKGDSLQMKFRLEKSSLTDIDDKGKAVPMKGPVYISVGGGQPLEGYQNYSRCKL